MKIRLQYLLILWFNSIPFIYSTILVYSCRFFDRDRDNLLSYNEFKNLITAVRRSKKQPVDALNVSRDAEACYKY